MKRSLLLPLLCLICGSAFSQPALPGDNQAPVRLSDIVAAYEQSEKPQMAGPKKETDRHGQEVEEKEDYLFDRWYWYWRQHTDAQGYLMSGAKTVQEWQSYQEQRRLTGAKTTGTANWSFQGPTQSPGGYSGLGRINTLAFHPSDINTYWIGAAGGGVWKTTNNGLAWTCLTDHLPALSVTDLDVNPLNPNTLYLCTGDGEGRDYLSIGILKSRDGGVTWDTTGLKWDVTSLRFTNSLAINRLDTNALILAASDGIYKSSNGGTSWTKVRSGYFKQVLYHPVDTAVIFATNYYTSLNGTAAQIFRSADGGYTWQQVTNLTNSYRITLAVTPADPKIVKAIAASYDPNRFRGLLGVYGSVDTGKTFSLLYAPTAACTGNILSGNTQGMGCTGQGNYDLAMAISPTDANKIYIGGVNSWYSVNGGTSWQLLNQWNGSLPGVATVHADKHFLSFHPLMPTRLFECNDGGIYRTDNPTSQIWTHLSNGLGITQFYRNAINVFNNDVLGGAQDNGTKGRLGNTWEDLTGGDGMECQTSALSPDILYTGVQYGVIYCSQDGGNSFDNISFNIPGQPDGAWITPFQEHPGMAGVLLAGYKEIYISNDLGQSWSSLSSPFPGNMVRLGLTPADVNTVYAVEEFSDNIYYTFDLGVTWNTLTAPYATDISDIQIDHQDKTHFWITLTGYGPDKVAEYRPATGWVAHNANLPNVPVTCIAYDTTTGDRYIGTEVGVFQWDATAGQWAPYNTNLPAVRVNDLAINYTTSELWAATYGRGMWKSPKPVPSGIRNIAAAVPALRVAPNPGNGAFTLSGFRDQKPVSLTLLDFSGRTVWQGKGLPAANGALKVNISSVAAGEYLLRAAGDQQLIGQTKLVIY